MLLLILRTTSSPLKFNLLFEKTDTKLDSKLKLQIELKCDSLILLIIFFILYKYLKCLMIFLEL